MTDEAKNKLEDITDVRIGTTEYEAYGAMGKKRREITGILSVKKNVRKYAVASAFIKPLAVSVSAIGFAFMIMLMTDTDIGSRTFWVAIAIGIVIGGFFEFVATAFEPALSTKKFDSTTTFKKRFIIGVKLYAVAMHIVTAYSLPSYIIDQKANNVSDSNEIKALVKRVDRLKEGLNRTDPRLEIYTDRIARLKEALVKKREEITEELRVNSTSKFVNKRRDAIRQINKINREANDIEKKIAGAENEKTSILSSSTDGLEEKITEVEKEIAEKRTQLTEAKKTESGNTGMLVFVLAILFIILELSGTVFSVLHNKEILEGVGEEIAMTEEVKSKLYSTKTAMKERNSNIKSFEIRDSIRENRNAVEMAEYEAFVKRENLRLQEIAINSKIELENSHLKLEAKINELDIVKHNQTLKAIDEKISQVLLIQNTVDIVPMRREEFDPKYKRKIGFSPNSKEELVKALYRDGEVTEGGKLTPKSHIINKNNRKEDEQLRSLYNVLQESNMIQFKPSYGYYAVADYETALSTIKG